MLRLFAHIEKYIVEVNHQPTLESAVRWLKDLAAAAAAAGEELPARRGPGRPPGSGKAQAATNGEQPASEVPPQ